VPRPSHHLRWVSGGPTAAISRARLEPNSLQQGKARQQTSWQLVGKTRSHGHRTRLTWLRFLAALGTQGEVSHALYVVLKGQLKVAHALGHLSTRSPARPPVRPLTRLPALRCWFRAEVALWTPTRRTACLRGLRWRPDIGQGTRAHRGRKETKETRRWSPAEIMNWNSWRC
jgi:hypothetical protein